MKSYCTVVENHRAETKTDVVAKISMLRLNIGSGMLRLSSSFLSLSFASSYLIIQGETPLPWCLPLSLRRLGLMRRG